MPKSKSLLFVELFLLEQANLVLRKKWWAQRGVTLPCTQSRSTTASNFWAPKSLNSRRFLMNLFLFDAIQ